jgi:hypothetical protein
MTILRRVEVILIVKNVLSRVIQLVEMGFVLCICASCDTNLKITVTHLLEFLLNRPVSQEQHQPPNPCETGQGD